MSNKENEYKEIFLAEAMDNHAELNRLLTQLEKNKRDKNTIDAIFRITHTLKGNAMGMGYTAIGELSHTLEDLFGVIREKNIGVDDRIISPVFKTLDVLSELLQSLNTGKNVSYKGIRTKLEVIMRELKEKPQDQATEAMLTTPVITETPNEEREPVGSQESQVVFSDLVQVPVRKLDNLLNLVGELIIEKDRLMATQHGSRNEYSRLHRIASDLQYSVMDVRLVQVGFLFNKFHRVVRDAANTENKSINLQLQGIETEIDRNILQVISDSLIHLIRNGVAHGIEPAAERKAAGKPEHGTITLNAYNEADAVVIEISDDGRGIDVQKVKRKAIEKNILVESTINQLRDEEIMMLIFEPGFSTVDQVTAISGRGVGMDVVKQALDSIGGTVEIISRAGEGCTFKLTLPSSMAVKSTLLFEISNDPFAIPLSFTESVISIYGKQIHRIGNGYVATHLDKPISVFFLKDTLGLNDGKPVTSVHPEEKLDIIVVSNGSKKVGLVVDKLLQQKEIVEKPLSKPVDKVSSLSGVTILGNGRVCLVLNVPMVLNMILGTGVRNRQLNTTP